MQQPNFMINENMPLNWLSKPIYFRSCVADNLLGRTKKYIEVSGRPGPAEFLSPTYSSHLDRYNLTFKIESIPPLQEIKLLYRKLMVSAIIIFGTVDHDEVLWI